MNPKPKKFASTISKGITIREIAEMLGVSHPTVSAVLNDRSYCYASEETKRRIKETARKLGYRPNAAALSLRGKPTGLIGVISTLSASRVNVDLLCEINGCVWRNGRHVLLGDSRLNNDCELELVREFMSKGVEGLILHNANEKRVLRETAQGRIPLVLVNREGLETDFATDRKLGGYLAGSHLARHGHRRIGFLCANIRTNTEKLEGFKTALADNKLPYDDSLVIEYDRCAAHEGRSVADLVKSGVTAFFATNDELAMRIIQFVDDMGLRVPRDVAVIGFDCASFSELTVPSLTSVRQPLEKLAEQSVAALLDMIARGGGQMELPPTRIPPELVIRNSCGCGADTRLCDGTHKKRRR